MNRKNDTLLNRLLHLHENLLLHALIHKRANIIDGIQYVGNTKFVSSLENIRNIAYAWRMLAHERDHSTTKSEDHHHNYPKQ